MSQSLWIMHFASQFHNGISFVVYSSIIFKKSKIRESKRIGSISAACLLTAYLSPAPCVKLTAMDTHGIGGHHSTFYMPGELVRSERREFKLPVPQKAVTGKTRVLGIWSTIWGDAP